MNEIKSKFGDLQDVVFGVNAQDSFMFIAQVYYERSLIEWALRLGSWVVLCNTLTKRSGTILRLFGKVGSVRVVVEVLSENIILLTEFEYYMEFFLDGMSITYWKHILNTFVKKIILLATFCSELEAKSNVTT